MSHAAIEHAWKERSRMARVLGELEVQKRAMDKQREEISLMREQVAVLEVEKSILIESNQSLSKSLT